MPPVVAVLMQSVLGIIFKIINYALINFGEMTQGIVKFDRDA